MTGAAENASDDTSVRDEAAVQSGDASSDSTDPSNDAQDSGASGETPDTSSVIESDGFPSQGAVIKLDEITIGIDRTELDPAEKFADVIYPQDTCRSTLISSEVKFGTPGLYPVVYRVNESTTGKDWYVVQPVRVSEAREAETQSEASYSTETQSTADDGASGQDESDGEHDGESLFHVRFPPVNMGWTARCWAAPPMGCIIQQFGRSYKGRYITFLQGLNEKYSLYAF